ncbi:hypothetical protein RCL1_005640 [Eukaryota sp. TZLM3-RCL]
MSAPLPSEFSEMKKLLEKAGLKSIDDSAVMAFIEYSYRYINEIYIDAHNWSHHAGRTELKSDDIQLAIRLKQTYESRKPLTFDSRHLKSSTSVNSKDIPQLRGKTGIPHPPERFCTLKTDYNVSLHPPTTTEVPRRIPMPTTLDEGQHEDELSVDFSFGDLQELKQEFKQEEEVEEMESAPEVLEVVQSQAELDPFGLGSSFGDQFDFE